MLTTLWVLCYNFGRGNWRNTLESRLIGRTGDFESLNLGSNPSTPTYDERAKFLSEILACI
jgi:hypothetical protein